MPAPIVASFEDVQRVLDRLYDGQEPRRGVQLLSSPTFKRVGTDGATGEAGFVNNNTAWNPVYVGNVSTGRPVLELTLNAGLSDEVWGVRGRSIVQANSANWTRFLMRYVIKDGAGNTVTTTGSLGDAQSHNSLGDGGWVDIIGAVYPVTVPAQQTRKIRMELEGSAGFGGSFWSGDWYTDIIGQRLA